MQNELSVRSENVQAVYGLYKNESLLVNRRYQRKLVGSIPLLQKYSMPVRISNSKFKIFRG